MNRKGFSPGIMIAILLGLFFIGIVVVGFGPKIFAYVNENYFGGFFKPVETKIPGAVAGAPTYQVINLSSNWFTALNQLEAGILDCWKKYESSNWVEQVCFKVGLPAVMSPAYEKGPPGVIYEDVLQSHLSISKNPLSRDISGRGRGTYAKNFEWSTGMEWDAIKGGGRPFYLCGRLSWAVHTIALTYNPGICGELIR
ncbi:MAG TPA: hypothetical protein VI612_04145 [Candidatus Nanoarchaeia archaeon]|nr:hypothetical protein [Candidatus Nanoarchaeia archaeon]